MPLQGVQLYIEIQDEDRGSDNRLGANEPDELVDILLINYNLTVGEQSTRQQYSGTFGFLTMDMAISVNCVNNFQGSDCTQCVPGVTGPDCLQVDDCFNLGINCSGNGQCVDGVDSFNCKCDPGFTGELCQTNIDECVGVKCSGNGECLDGVNSFTCECSPGYTGPLCGIQGIFYHTW